MADAAKIEVWYDGQCGLCRSARTWAERRDRDGRLEFRDLNDPAEGEALPAPREELLRSMWTRRPDGALASGFAGWLEVLRALPGWSRLAGLLVLPPFSWLGPPVYRFVANRRPRLAMAAFAGSCGDDRETCGFDATGGAGPARPDRRPAG